MSEKIFINEIVEGTYIRALLLVTEKSLRETKSGKPFLALKLCDKSGNIDAKVWENAEALATRFQADDFIRVEAQVDSWQSQLQLNVRDLQKVEDAQVDLADFIPASRWPRAELLDQLKALLNEEIKSPLFARLFDALFADEALMERFVMAPAAKTNHHAFLGGLLEHSLSMTRLALKIGRHYEHYYPGLVNADLLLAGCVFHDIGKCFELNFARRFDYSEAGQFVGHIVQGVELLNSISAQLKPALPEPMLLQIKHLILSHHGKKEYGSPTLPKTPEAMLLHEIDMIDSRMNMLANIARDQQAEPGEEIGWTGYQRLFGERLHLGVEREIAESWFDSAHPTTAKLAGPGLAAGAEEASLKAPLRAQSPAGKPAADASPEPAAPNLDLFGD